MENEFSFIELRVIQSLIRKKSFAEIAAAVDKPLELVTEYIRKITAGKSIITRQSKIEGKLDTLRSKKKENVIKKKKKLAEAESDKAREKELKRLRRLHDHESSGRRKMAEPAFKTRDMDLSKMISVRIDSKTVLQVPAGSNIETVKKNYHERLQNSTKEVTHYKVVKKFKPV